MPTIISGDGTITGLTATGISAVQNLPAGSVLQVVNTQSQAAEISTTSATYVTTNISASITPKFSTSKIFLLLSCNLDNQTSGNQLIITFYKNGSDLLNRGANELYGSASRIQSAGTSMYLDSPATTSSTTYSIYFRSTTGGNSVRFGSDNTLVSFTLMEIAG